jgi:hypothetical protein
MEVRLSETEVPALAVSKTRATLFSPFPAERENPMEKEFEKLAIVIAATILVARKLATAPRNSPAYVSAIADAVADARRIVERIYSARSY